jgi:hypothetical protein
MLLPSASGRQSDVIGREKHFRKVFGAANNQPSIAYGWGYTSKGSINDSQLETPCPVGAGLPLGRLPRDLHCATKALVTPDLMQRIRGLVYPPRLAPHETNRGIFKPEAKPRFRLMSHEANQRIPLQPWSWWRKTRIFFELRSAEKKSHSKSLVATWTVQFQQL